MDTKFINSLIESARNEDLTEYIAYIKGYMLLLKEQGEEIDPYVFAAACYKKATEVKENKVEKVIEHQEKMTFTPNENAKRFFINIGEQDGLTQQGLIDFICGILDGVTKDDFSDVFLRRTFSFFELPSEMENDVIALISNNVYNGREVRVEVSEQRKEKDKKEERGNREFKSSSRSKKDFSSKKGFDRSKRDHSSKKRQDRNKKSSRRYR